MDLGAERVRGEARVADRASTDSYSTKRAWLISGSYGPSRQGRKTSRLAPRALDAAATKRLVSSTIRKAR